MATADAHARSDATGEAAPDVTIRAEAAGEEQAVRALQAAAFGDPDRVPGLVDALRAARAAVPPLSFVAVAHGITTGVSANGIAGAESAADPAHERIVGHVMLSACRLDALPRLVDVYSLSPLGVHPDHQGRGIGTRLIAHALAAADASGVPLVFLEGSPRYYSARGFRPAEELGFRPPTLRYPPGAFQVAALAAHEEWMTGTFVYSDTFWALDCVGLRGDDLAEARAHAQPPQS
ncbi:GNAT family N-acetyltransferase [Streptomyces sp. NPDC020917]|uniref:GNAT family N-acetyltransferase n=1 Tax=Streptomyces sp. NPDC020917 TaxID=3365102 RepID=UPI0037ACCB6B